MLLATATSSATGAAWLDLLAVGVCAVITPVIFLAVGFWLWNEVRARGAEDAASESAPDPARAPAPTGGPLVERTGDPTGTGSPDGT